MNFNELPEKVREWIGSEKITYLISDLNKQHGIPEEDIRFLPSLIYKLVTGSLKPEDVKRTITERLQKDEASVNNIINDIRDKTLKPIERNLQSMGIDIQRIVEGRAGKIAVKQPPAPAVDLRNAHTKTQTTPQVPATPQPQSQPFILHRAGGTSTPQAPLQPPTPQANQVNQVNLQKTPPATQAAVTDEQKKQSAERRVHYSGPVTQVE